MQHHSLSILSCCCLAAQGADWSPFVVTDGKLITAQNPQVKPPDFLISMCATYCCIPPPPRWNVTSQLDHSCYELLLMLGVI